MTMIVNFQVTRKTVCYSNYKGENVLLYLYNLKFIRPCIILVVE